MKWIRIICFGLSVLFCLQLSGVSYATYDFPIQVSKIFSGQEQSNKLKLMFLQVGQGDATLLILPNQKTVLIDGGPHEAGEVIMNKLIEKGIKRLDLVVSTHPDMDHIGGLIPIIQQVPVAMVLDSGKPYGTLTYHMYVRSVKKRRIPFIPAEEGKFLQMDPDVSIQVLNTGKRKLQNNESSVVLKIRYKKADFLLMADADVKTEKKIIQTYPVHADVLKIGHHGSYTSTGRLLLENVYPQFAVISYEKGNPYGHPHRSVMKRIRKFGIQVYTTADGDVEMETDGNSLQIQGGSPLPLLR